MHNIVVDIQKTTRPAVDRPFRLFEFSEGGAAIDVMAYPGHGEGRRPLIVLHSIEYPIPPSVEFCERMSAAGFQVIFVRRAGFGRSTGVPRVLFADDLVRNGATCTSEAALLAHMLDRLSLNNIVLLALSSAGPLGYRLAEMTSRISHLLLSNPRLNQTAWESSRPGWFKDTLQQIFNHRSGVRLAEKGMKLLVKRDPLSFYRQFLRNSMGDIAYLETNVPDFIAAKNLLLQIPSDVIWAETTINLARDRFLLDRCFGGKPVIVLAGAEATQSWRLSLKNEAERVGATFELTPVGDLFGAYLSPDFVASLIKKSSKSGNVT